MPKQSSRQSKGGVGGHLSREFSSTAENVELGPIQKRKRSSKKNSSKNLSNLGSGNGSIQSTSSISALNATSNETSSSTGSSNDQWYKDQGSDLGKGMVCRDDHQRIHDLKLAPSTFLSITLNPLTPPPSSGPNYNFNSSSSAASSVVISCDATPLPASPMGFTMGFIQGIPTTADSLDRFIGTVDKNGYGEIDFINYNRNGRPYVNRLSLSPSRAFGTDEITHYLAMLQSFDDSPGSAAAVTATTTSNSGGTNSSDNLAFTSSSSNNEDSTDTSSSSSNERRKKREKSNNSTTSSNSAQDDADVINILSKKTDSEDTSDGNSSSDGIEISDGDITSFLANNSDGSSTFSVNSDEASQNGPVKKAKITEDTYPLAAKFVAARVDLETAWRAAYASAMGHNAEIVFHHPRQTTSSSGAEAGGEPSSTESLAQNSTSNSNPSGSSPLPSSSPSPTIVTTTIATTNTTALDTASVPTNLNTWGVEITRHLNSGIDAFLNFSRGSKSSLCLINRKGKIVHVNASFVSLTGYRLEECEQKTIKDILWGPGTDAFGYQELWKQVSTTSISNSCILVSYRQTGEGFLSKVGLYGVGKEYFCLFLEEVNANMIGATKLSQGLTDHSSGKIIKIFLCHPQGDRTENGSVKPDKTQLRHLVEGN